VGVIQHIISDDVVKLF